MKKVILLLCIVLSTKVAISQTTISGVISENTTWTLENSPYLVTGNTIISQESTLTINEGVRVEFNSNVVLRIEGEINALGSADQKIIFTSSQESPNTGDWGHLLFTDSSNDAVFVGGNYLSGNYFRHCKFEFGGSLNRGIISIDYSSPYFLFCEIHNSASDGINTDHGAFRIDSSRIHNNRKGTYSYRYPATDIILIGNEIYDNRSGGIHFENIHDSNTKIHINGNSIYRNNGTGAIHADEGQNTTFIIENNEIYNNSASDGGALFTEGGELTFRCNIVEENYASKGGAISIIGDFASHNYLIQDNFFSKNSGNSSIFEISFFVTNYSTLIDFSNNYISNNSSNGNIFSLKGDADESRRDITYDVENNIIENNQCNNVVEVEYFKGSISNNSFSENNTQYILYNSNEGSMLSISAENNYWGSSDELNIQESIYDFLDDGNLSVVNYSPYLSSPGNPDYTCSSIQFERDTLNTVNVYANNLTIALPVKEAEDYGYILERSNSIDFNSYSSYSFDTAYQFYKDTILNPLTVYYYRLKTLNSAKKSPYSATLNVTTMDTIYTPSSLLAQDVFAKSTRVTWNDNSSNETNFIIERDTTNSFNNPIRDTLIENSIEFLSTNLEPLTTYFYRVLAFNGNTRSNYSDFLEIQTEDTIYSPSSLLKIDSTTKSITISWTDNSENESRFVVQRDMASEFLNAITDTIPANTTTHLSENLEPNSAYFFRVYAFNENTTSDYSNLLEAHTEDSVFTPSLLTVIDSSAQSITISWTDNSENESSFVVQTDIDSEFLNAITDTIPANTTTHLSENLEPNSAYFFRVYAFNENTTSGYSNIIVANTLILLSVEEKINTYVYPNPSSKEIRVRTTDPLSITLVDQSGRKIPINSEWKNGILYLNIERLENGVYYLNIVSNDIDLKSFTIYKK